MQISKEVYDEIRAQIDAERKEKRRESLRITKEVKAMFEPTWKKYAPKMIIAFNGLDSCYPTSDVKLKFRQATIAAVKILGERNERDVYLKGKAEEANEITSAIIEEMLNAPPKEYIPTVKDVWEARKIIEERRNSNVHM